jgi:hypothetical protein
VCRVHRDQVLAREVDLLGGTVHWVRRDSRVGERLGIVSGVRRMIRRAEDAGDESGEVVAAFGVSLLPVIVYDGS